MSSTHCRQHVNAPRPTVDRALERLPWAARVGAIGILLPLLGGCALDPFRNQDYVAYIAARIATHTTQTIRLDSRDASAANFGPYWLRAIERSLAERNAPVALLEVSRSSRFL